MNADILKNLLYCVGFASIFLIIGFFIRAKVKFFGDTFLPSSVIGGFLLLLLGPNVFNVINIPNEWIQIYSLLPGILIIPICAAIPLGIKFSFSKCSNDILILIGIFSAMPMLQISLGFLINYIFKESYDLYPTFGLELGLGYIGGHGSAGVLGNILQNANLPFWEISQGITITFATFGLIGGIIIGIIIINFASRYGYTNIIKSPSKIPNSYKKGYSDAKNQNMLGKETTLSTSLDSIAFHLAIIFSVCAISYFLIDIMKYYKVAILSEITIWAYTIIIMIIVWSLMIKLKIDFLIDNDTKSHISSAFSEFAIISAIASLPIKTIFIYFIPILILAIVGFIITILFLYITCRLLVKSFWFEHMIALFGCSTGVFITGLLLLKVCDPEFKSNVMNNYVLSFSVSSIILFTMINLILAFIINYGVLYGLIFCLAMSLLFILFSFIIHRIYR